MKNFLFTFRFIRATIISAFLLSGTAAKADKNTTTGWETWTDCLVPVNEAWNKSCTGSYFVQWRNTCSEPMDIQYAFQRTDGKWVLGLISAVKPGEERGGFACTATGKYYVWARPTRIWLEVKFPTAEQIKAGTIPGPVIRSKNSTTTPPETGTPNQPASTGLASCNASLPDILLSKSGEYYMRSGDGCFRKITSQQYARYKQLNSPQEKKRFIQSCTGNPLDTLRFEAKPYNGN